MPVVYIFFLPFLSISHILVTRKFSPVPACPPIYTYWPFLMRQNASFCFKLNMVVGQITFCSKQCFSFKIHQTIIQCFKQNIHVKLNYMQLSH
ncbi:hypothetical protein CHS0354_026130 [Potamilus streckersoni]|uniref:Secreted protein n=1 Tax=Potamilus streckersoni TaxID=2493646 RepID=A0AAE0VNU9_9BIVA|nr:hypothetical protein CHS0354_026130 [Potamilus streckersoni]